ncbi:MAG: hypothetical protein LQ347_002959 [Umbilicaria vellea]|nr:MAG: hypothetical protein LQ347_002959 [Umbilicaria vellea]
MSAGNTQPGTAASGGSQQGMDFNDFQDQNGQTPLKPTGQAYQDFPWLPNQISVEPEAFMLEYWSRKNPLCSYADFEIRMQPGHNENLPARNALNMRRIREVRLPLNIFSWHQRGEKVTLTDCLIFESLSLDSVQENTVLSVRPWGLIKPALSGPPAPAAGHQNAANLTAQIPLPAPLPLGTFNDGNATHVPSAKLTAIKELTACLQDKAFEQMLAHWVFLRDEDKPLWWDEHTHNRNRNLISIPILSALPHLARNWIKECVREAGEPESRWVVPPMSVLPKTVQGWVAECLKEGRARSVITPAGQQARTDWSLEVEASDDSYISDLSLLLNYPEVDEQGNVGGSEHGSDVSDSSSVSETFSVQSSVPEISERTEATWAEHWKDHYRDKVITE